MTKKIDGYQSSQPLVTVSVKGAKSVKNAALEKNAAVQTVGASSADQVTLTESAKSLQKIEEALANAPVVNSAKVAAVKQAVDNGTYKVDSGRVADKILRFERNLN